jgi:hypothetical protein
MSNRFRYLNSSSEAIRLVVVMYVRYPLSLRNVEEPAARSPNIDRAAKCIDYLMIFFDPFDRPRRFADRVAGIW